MKKLCDVGAIAGGDSMEFRTISNSSNFNRQITAGCFAWHFARSAHVATPPQKAARTKALNGAAPTFLQMGLGVCGRM